MNETETCKTGFVACLCYRVEYDTDTLNPKGFWANLATLELQQRALGWDGAVMVRFPRIKGLEATGDLI